MGLREGPRPAIWAYLQDTGNVLQRAIQISDALYGQSLKIMNSKKTALEKGDETVIEQMSKGKDIMSICRTLFIQFSC